MENSFAPRIASVAQVAAALVLAVGPIAAQQGPAPVEAVAEPAKEKEAERPRLVINGFIDGVFAYNFNRPDDHANFFTGVGTSAKRENEFTINLAQVDLVLAPAPVGFHLALGYGTGPEVLHAAEVSGVVTDPDVWRHLMQASIQYQTRLGRGLLVEGGVYPSHIGFETFATKDNWNYTRSWLGELSPYYQTGVKVAYPLGEHWSAQVHLLNGWQMIADNNRGKTVGWCFAYAADKGSISLNGIVGPELPEDDHDIRALLDVVAQYKPTPSLSLALSVDVAREERPIGADAEWSGIALYARLAPVSSHTAVALRTEYYDDEDGAISGTAQTLREVTATLELRPVERLVLKVEGRYDRSSAGVFGSVALDTGGGMLLERDELLLLVGVVASFP
jgi:hypothetical protein